jgi:hypothetical protein
MAHTPGPWEARPVPAINTIVIAKAGALHSHAQVVPHAETRPLTLTEREYANARLIAAAPDLLEACHSAMRGEPGWAKRIHAAVAKATGGRP